MPPKICILRTDGTNCDLETFYAFNKAGGESELVHINQLRQGEVKLAAYHILVIPGGFSYGDDIGAGKVLAVELISFLKEQLAEFWQAKKPILGICNGFQVLVRTGLLPAGKLGSISAALTANKSGRFECRWIKLKIEKNNCIFTQGLDNKIIYLPVAHGEGNFYTDSAALNNIEVNSQVTFRYVDKNYRPTQTYPDNPNGSLNAIAGLCDPSGYILGLMPHPERFTEIIHHPNWRRNNLKEPQGLAIFRNAVQYVKGS